jgi:hypothetical protein
LCDALRPHPPPGLAIRAGVDHSQSGPEPKRSWHAMEGKTLIGAELARDLGAGRVLVVVSTLDLLPQTAVAYTKAIRRL